MSIQISLQRAILNFGNYKIEEDELVRRVILYNVSDTNKRIKLY